MKVLLSGCNTKQAVSTVLKVDPTNLMSDYFYLRKLADNGRSLMELATSRGASLSISSGSATFLKKYACFRTDIVDSYGDLLKGMDHHKDLIEKSREKNGEKTREEIKIELREYFYKYLEWLKENSDLIETYHEFDVECLLTEHDSLEDEIWDWRAEYYSNVSPDSSEVIITTHTNDFLRIFEEDTFKYIGLSPAVSKDPEHYNDFFQKWLPLLEKKQIKVHGWSTTGNSLSGKHPFYSADSSAWIMGGAFGSAYIYKGKLQMRNIGRNQKSVHKTLRTHIENAGADFDKFCAGDYKEFNLSNAYQWRKYQEDAEALSPQYLVGTNEGRSYLEDEVIDGEFEEEVIKTLPSILAAPPKILSEIEKIKRQCNTCLLKKSCYKFLEDSECRLDPSSDVRSQEAFTSAVSSLIEMQLDRVKFAVFAEKISGTVDKEVTKEIKAAMDLIEQSKNIFDNRDEVTVKIKAGGVLTKMFGGYGKSGQGKPGQRGDR